MSASHISVDQVLTIGVEEEFYLADRESLRAVSRAGEVVANARAVLGERVQAELFASQVELVSSPHLSAADLRSELLLLRQTGAAFAADSGCLLVASGSAVLNDWPLPVFNTGRYQEIGRRFESVLRRMRAEPSGCHVHLGTLAWSEALALTNHLRPWLPILQALCVNSPFAGGRQRGCLSWRHFDFGAWPQARPAPILTESVYARQMDSWVSDGKILDRRMMYWYARPSEHVPTVEIRVADANWDLDVIMLMVLLARGLGTALLAEIRAGVYFPQIGRGQVERAHRLAAATGPTGPGISPLTGTALPMSACLQLLLDRARPGLEAAGDVELVAELMAALRARRTGAERQLVLVQSGGSLHDLVRMAAIEEVADDSVMAQPARPGR
ncbi:carboxylate-amine ligase [Catenulispora rubra]|uniref:carboxylate-amine ligase n=1 Tax=Catenulispora rubra TaxID=280293 RepID=UPI0018927D3D|nr:glutamate-cysteine ligase family protein [Catenulispora rubra]